MHWNCRILKIDDITRIRIRLILMQFLETSDCTNDCRKHETCLQFKMKMHYIKTRKISQIICFIKKKIAKHSVLQP